MDLCKGLCSDCRNLINVIDSNTIQCEAYIVTKCKNKCRGHLSCKCEDEKQIHKNNAVIADMYLENEERRMYG